MEINRVFRSSAEGEEDVIRETKLTAIPRLEITSVEMPNMIAAMNSSSQIIVHALQEAGNILGAAAGEIQAVANRKLILHPDGRQELDLSTIVQFSSHGIRQNRR